MNRSRRETIVALTAVAVTPVVTAGAFTRVAAAQTSALSPQEARAIAKEVFLWGMHPVAIYHLRYNHVQNDKSPAYVGVGRLSWERKAKKANRVATTPNATTLYGVGFYDLSKEPVVITVGDIKDHYWSIQLCDNYARWWQLIGSQFNAPGPVRRVLIGPNWSGKYPPEFVGAEVVQAPSDMMCVVGRVALTDDTAEELKVVNGIQDRMTVMSLSQWVAAGKKDVKAEDVPLTKRQLSDLSGHGERQGARPPQGRGFPALGEPDPERPKLHQADGRPRGSAGVRQVRAPWSQSRPDLRSGETSARHQGRSRGRHRGRPQSRDRATSAKRPALT